MSYNGGIDFGLLADYDAMDDVGVIAEGIESAIAELLQEADKVNGEPSPVSAQRG
jgi:diacylglycerol O-acyltransferase / wax synthase